jgi:hypothetical protein
MNSIYSIVIISLSIVTFALISVGIPTAYENVVAQQDGNSSSNDINMSSLEEDRIYPNMSSLEEDR